MGHALVKITQFGHSSEEGGWDTYGDKASDAFKGDHENLMLSGVDCAMTQSAIEAIGGVHKKPGQWVEIDFKNGAVYRRRIGDTAPELDKRCDFLNYYAFDKQMDAFGAYAVVTLLADAVLLT